MARGSARPGVPAMKMKPPTDPPRRPPVLPGMFDVPSTIEMPHFDGETYSPEDDHARLGAQSQAVFTLMEDGRWRTLADISLATGFPEASISARLRDFRKEKFGSHTVQRQRTSEGAGTWEYRLTPTAQQQDVLSQEEVRE
jgi:hypothetical protein